MAGLLERFLMKLNISPLPYLDVASAGGFRAVASAVRLGLFEALERGPLTPTELSAKAHTDERATALLLALLETYGYVREKNSRFSNTRMTSKWLLKGSPVGSPEGISFYDILLSNLWGGIDESVANGKPPTTFEEWLAKDPSRWRQYQRFMLSHARSTAEEVVRKVKLPGTARRLLDLGGGHGLYGVRFCQRHPNLSATIFDRAEALELARETIAAERIGDRVSVHSGDYLTDEIGSGYDVVLLFGSIHQYSPDTIGGVFRKISRALNPRGVIAIAEELTKGRVSTETAWLRFEALNYFVLYGGQTYSFNELADWLMVAGFSAPRKIRLTRTTYTIILATRASP